MIQLYWIGQRPCVAVDAACTLHSTLPGRGQERVLPASADVVECARLPVSTITGTLPLPRSN